MKKDATPDSVTMASAQNGFTAPNVFDVTDVNVMFLESKTNPILNVAPKMLASPAKDSASKLKCDEDEVVHPDLAKVQSDEEEDDKDHKNEEPVVISIETEKQYPKMNRVYKSAKSIISKHLLHKNQCKTDPKKRKRKTPMTSRKVVYYTKEMGYYRQCFQPRFEYPHSCFDLLTCKGADFLLVFVGLCNILLLQFILVVLMFFSQEEINQDTFKEDSYSSSHKSGRPW